MRHLKTLSICPQGNQESLDVSPFISVTSFPAATGLCSALMCFYYQPATTRSLNDDKEDEERETAPCGLDSKNQKSPLSV